MSFRSIDTQAKNVTATVGNIMSNDVTLYVMLLTAFATLVASICIPYYTDSTGASSAIYAKSKDCLGFTGDDCVTIHTFPVLTTVLVGLTVLFMGIQIYLEKHPIPSFIKGSLVEQLFLGTGIVVPVLLALATIFSIVMLGTQLGLPLSGKSLADQAKDSTTPTTFKDGMALSATAATLVIFIAIIQFGIFGRVSSVAAGLKYRVFG